MMNGLKIWKSSNGSNDDWKMYDGIMISTRRFHEDGDEDDDDAPYDYAHAA